MFLLHMQRHLKPFLYKCFKGTKKGKMSGMLTFGITVALSSRAFIQGAHMQGFNIWAISPSKSCHIFGNG